MKRILIFIILILSSGIAQATYINDQVFILSTGAHLTVNTTTIDDTNQLVYYPDLMLRINGSTTNYTTSTNKTITSVTFNNVTDVLTIPVSGTAGYFNFSVTMNNASTDYTLSGGTTTESKSTQSDKSIWFNYTGAYPATLTVSKVSATVAAGSGGGGGNTGSNYSNTSNITSTPTPTLTLPSPMISGGGKSWSPISYEGVVSFASPYIEQAKKYIYPSTKPNLVIYVLIFSGLIMFLILSSKSLR